MSLGRELFRVPKNLSRPQKRSVQKGRKRAKGLQYTAVARPFAWVAESFTEKLCNFVEFPLLWHSPAEDWVSVPKILFWWFVDETRWSLANTTITIQPVFSIVTTYASRKACLYSKRVTSFAASGKLFFIRFSLFTVAACWLEKSFAQLACCSEKSSQVRFW